MKNLRPRIITGIIIILIGWFFYSLGGLKAFLAIIIPSLVLGAILFLSQKYPLGEKLHIILTQKGFTYHGTNAEMPYERKDKEGIINIYHGYTLNKSLQERMREPEVARRYLHRDSSISYMHRVLFSKPLQIQERIFIDEPNAVVGKKDIVEFPETNFIIRSLNKKEAKRIITKNIITIVDNFYKKFEPNIRKKTFIKTRRTLFTINKEGITFHILRNFDSEKEVEEIIRTGKEILKNIAKNLEK